MIQASRVEMFLKKKLDMELINFLNLQLKIFHLLSIIVIFILFETDDISTEELPWIEGTKPHSIELLLGSLIEIQSSLFEEICHYPKNHLKIYYILMIDFCCIFIIIDELYVNLVQ
ncbi:hypothetical protein ACTFIV_008523 [Dictyostelium citrinum]